MAVEVTQLRNIGIIGQGGGGKTSLADAMLFTAGATTRRGNVDDGSSAFDFEPEETRRKLSLTTAFHHAPWKKQHVTLVDTPGYINFLTDGLNAMRACTAALFVLEPSRGGVKVEAERLWSRAEQLALPCVGFVTKMDRENADFEAALHDAGTILQAKPVPVQIPIGSAESFRGVIDLIGMQALIAQPDGSVKEEAIPADLADAAKTAREKLMEAVAETDDALVEQYLESGELSPEQLTEALRTAVRDCRFMPVLVGSGAKVMGIAPLLDFLVEYTPSPAERPAAVGEDAKGEPLERAPSPSAPFSAIVFKTVVDPFSGKLSVFQVVSGELHGDSTILNVNKDAKERMGHLLRLEGKKQSQVEKLTTGEIGAVAKLKDTEAGDTLADEKAPIRYSGLVAFSAAISFAIEPKTKGDEEKAMQGLHRLMEEDPTLRMQRDAQTKEIILSGVGQLHIEVTVEKLKRKFGVDVELKAPKVPYKETIKGSAKAQGRLKKQTGGRGQFGDAWLEVSPLPRGSGFEFVDDVVGGVIPRQFIPAVEKGVREALHEGVVAGFEIVDVRVRLYDGSHHSVDSSEMAFKIAASMGFKTALGNARPILLEPVMVLEIAVPDDCMGDVIGDLNSRRGKVLGVDPKVGSQVIRALVPMSEVLRYSPDLRSMTSGRGAFTMEFDHYDELPSHLADKVVKEAEERKSGATLMDEPENLEALAEDIQAGRDTIVVPEVLLVDRGLEPHVAGNLQAQLRDMSVGARLKLALRGNRDARTLLLRDGNRLVQKFVLQNPRITDEEIIAMAKNRNIDREMLDGICRRKEWVSNYQVRLSLATNPKTPLAMAVRFVPTLLPRDLRILAKSRNVPAAVNGMAKRLVIERGG